LHEIKLIVDLIYEGGISNMRYSISNTAEYGDMTRGPRIIDAQVKENMKRVLQEVQDGSFAKEWMEEYRSGSKRFQELRNQAKAHPIEKVGEQLRSMMGWMSKEKLL
jgi:ketol-acid reductoisomerase